MNINRRIFLKSSLTSAALLTLPDLRGFALPPSPAPTELFTLSNTLVQTWGDKLLSMQITDATHTTDYGGIYCPVDKAVHGRCADAIYPFFFLAHKNNAHKYIDASLLLYQWMETHVSQDDGSWLNEPVKGSWKGTTVFTAIALAETIKHYGALMDPAFKARLMDRLRKAGEYVHANFTIEYGNINYPITATYGLSLLGEILDIQKFKDRGRELARQVLKFITPKDRLLHGEGDPYDKPSPKGCFSIDLGYAVEESLPSLVAYGLLTKDEEALGVVTQSLRAHLEFMLPDGGWDNSWGTRNYKWTYWGSRTTDGSQTAFTALADRDRSFYTAALANTRLLQQHTYDGLLYGGPHFHSHNIIPCVHHTFCHIKALTAVASRDSFQQVAAKSAPLPRQNTYGLRAFSDIQTWLVAKRKIPGYHNRLRSRVQKNTQRPRHRRRAVHAMARAGGSCIVCQYERIPAYRSRQHATRYRPAVHAPYTTPGNEDRWCYVYQHLSPCCHRNHGDGQKADPAGNPFPPGRQRSEQSTRRRDTLYSCIYIF